jgi:hypothetical protein
MPLEWVKRIYDIYSLSRNLGVERSESLENLVQKSVGVDRYGGRRLEHDGRRLENTSLRRLALKDHGDGYGRAGGTERLFVTRPTVYKHKPHDQ